MSSNPQNHDPQALNHSTIGEETPLLPQPTKKGKTPLPKAQLSIILLAALSEPISSQCIYPFINQLVSELDITGGDERKVGYYAGLIESLFFTAQALTVLRWSRLSDVIGRKPVILIGLFGLCISNVAFGLSRTFWTLIISRSFAGLLNGNIGVMKSMIGELTDSTNMAQAFATLPLLWCVGVTVGPFMGGFLSRPHDRFPGVFSGTFWIQYPYFLPCFAAACFTAIGFLAITLFAKETLPSRKVKAVDFKSTSHAQTASDHDVLPSGIPAAEQHQTPTDEIIPLRVLIASPSVMVPIANYGLLALLDLAFLALQPLFYSTPTNIGGLGFKPSTIGSWMALFGIIDGVFQFLFLAKIVDRWGAKRIFTIAVACFFPLITLFPVMTWVVRSQGGVGPTIWALLVLQLIVGTIMDMSYATIFIFVTSAAPNKRSLGALNGLGQTTASIARAIAPAMSTSLFALTMEKNLLGGYAVYLIFYVLSGILVWLATRLPDQLPERD
ncbi:major facilitator superfamily domain-containing protein [Hygrophoropsis aurantiaca]|uniref:Major facilitator superfamily domain-containing protein n=1 Tax=Hygrophoropsis aurantiaca TaxID=72124 RepID=A0ACB7ZZS4_9AGAM|nr:major facilitator superfamily domain-containing protein [Hygrophoropsis aurantiaca]